MSILELERISGVAEMMVVLGGRPVTVYKLLSEYCLRKRETTAFSMT